jgi:hypothetical protein
MNSINLNKLKTLMKEAVEKIVKALVGDADAVEVSEKSDGRKHCHFKCASAKAIWAESSGAKVER